MAYTSTPDSLLIASLYNELSASQEADLHHRLMGDLDLQAEWLALDRTRDFLRSARVNPSTGVLEAIKAFSQATNEQPELV